MPFAELPSLRLFYEISGPPDGAPLVLIHGLGAQMIAWHPGFAALLEKAGFRVIRFDNRDVGLSSKMAAAPDYAIGDMANDIAGLIAALGLSSVHVLGQSMGGLIAQHLALQQQSLVRSMTLVYAPPDPSFVEMSPDVWELRHRPPPASRAEAIDHYIACERVSGLDGFDDEEIERFAAAVYDRCYCPEGAARQESAVLAAPPILADLPRLVMPVSVVHGRDDALVSWKAAIAIAEAVASADLHLFAGMGHQIPPRLWSDIVAIVRRTAERSVALQ